MRLRTLALALTVSVTAVAVMGACGKKKSDSKKPTETEEPVPPPVEDTTIRVQGALNLATSLHGGFNIAATDLKVYCVAFTNPPVAGTGEVGADNKFAFDMPSAKGAPLGCFILNKSDDSVLGSVVFKTAKKGMGGGNRSEARMAFSDDTNLGVITFNPTTGVAEVDTSQITTVSAAVTTGEVYDFGGSYVIRKFDGALPTGYKNIPAPEECELGQDGQRHCNGPSAGETLWVKRLNGADTITGAPKFGIMVWQSKAAFETCDSRVGFTVADAQQGAGVTFSASANPGVTFDSFSWDLEDGWKDTQNARTGQWPMNECWNEAGAYVCNLYASTDGQTISGGLVGTERWVNSEETGCTKGGARVQWPDMQEGVYPQCENGTPVTQGGFTYNKSVCTYTDGTQCTSIGGRFATSSTTAAAWDNPTVGHGHAVQKVLVPANTLCSSISNGTDPKRELAELKCFAEHFWRAGFEKGEAGAGLCLRGLRTNWDATTPEGFLAGNDGPQKARGEHVLELFDYADPNTGSFRFEERYREWVSMGQGGMGCEVGEAFTMTLRRVPGSTNLVAEIEQSRKVLNETPACLEGVKGGTQRFMMKMERTGD